MLSEIKFVTQRLGLCGVKITFTAAMVVLACNAAWGGRLHVLHSFTFGADGANPSAGLIVNDDGTILFGTAEDGGLYGKGVVFKLERTPQGWQETVLHDFGQGEDGWYPAAALVLHRGSLFGTTLESAPSGYGTVFELKPENDGTWTEQVLHVFGFYGEDTPSAPVVFDNQGNLYGTASLGGVGSPFGAVFQMTPPTDEGGVWKEAVLYNFTFMDDGAYPDSALFVDQAGNLYGTSYFGAISDNGTVYELQHTSDGWQELTLYEFTEGSDGGNPSGPLVPDGAGNFYGAAEFGGDNENGVVFKLTHSATGWTESAIYSFKGGNDGSHPRGGVSRDHAGNLYGTTDDGGAGGLGTVFKLSPNFDGTWSEAVLYSFTGGQDGLNPIWGVVPDHQGRVYGISDGGSPCSCGAVFEVIPPR